MFAVCAASWVAVYGAFALPQFAFAPWGDTVHLTGPLFCEVSHNTEITKAPLLNWSTFEALDYNPHISALYPFYLTAWLDFCSPEAAVQASDLIAVLHLAILTLTLGQCSGSTRRSAI